MFLQLLFAESQLGEYQVQAGYQAATSGSHIARMSTWKFRYLQNWLNTLGYFFKNAVFQNNKFKSAKNDND